MTDDLEATRHIVEGLGHIGADPAQSASAVRTAARCRVNNLLAGQMVRQQTPRRFSACFIDGTGNRRDSRHPLGVVFLKGLDRKLELLDGSIDFLRRSTKLGALQAGKLEAQPLDLSPCQNRIPRHRANDAFERTNVKSVGSIDTNQL